MTEHPSTHSHLPEGSREHSYVVYRAGTGEIVHGHTAIVLPYGDADEPDYAQQALDAAAAATGLEVASLQTLAVRRTDLEHGAVYRVDVETQRIIRHRPD
jgi:hypothetical protein